MDDSKVLIVTSKDDVHADNLIMQALQLGLDQRTVRINTEDFGTNSAVSFDGTNFLISLADSGRSLSSDQLVSVWFRRPKDIAVSEELELPAAAFARKQWTAFLRGLYFSTHGTAKWYNPLPAIHAARIKLPQLVLAAEVGMRVPKVCVTNSSDEAATFFGGHERVCTKSLDEPSVEADGHLFPMYTRIIESVDEFDDENSIAVAPILLQEFIEKTHDVRVVVVDDKIFAVRIDSQTRSDTSVDFRTVSPHLLGHEAISLPLVLEDQIKNFVGRQGLRFSSMDFCIDRETGDFVFLENNCNGQWLWLERQCGVKITDAMISALYGAEIM